MLSLDYLITFSDALNCSSVFSGNNILSLSNLLLILVSIFGFVIVSKAFTAFVACSLDVVE